MELHPILERGCLPQPGLWYVLPTEGDFPAARVGHTCTVVTRAGGDNGCVYVLGGANPSGTHPDTFLLDLEHLRWRSVPCPETCRRYEHSAVTTSSSATDIYVFGGANQETNLNDVQRFSCTMDQWVGLVPVDGPAPSPRTYHCTSSVGKLVVYCGGQAGAEPVPDKATYILDLASMSWSTVKVTGDTPKPRHGHVTVLHGDRVYVHAGMAGQRFYDDLAILDLRKGQWVVMKSRKGWPCARASHGGALSSEHLYIMGGMGRDGALDDLYQLNIASLRWTKMDLAGPPPTPRLDFGMCVITLKVPEFSPGGAGETDEILNSSMHAKDMILRSGSASSGRSDISSAGSQRSGPTIVDVTPTNLCPNVDPCVAGDPSCSAAFTGPYKVVDLLLVVGGMDTEGEFFDDCMVYLIKEHPTYN